MFLQLIAFQIQYKYEKLIYRYITDQVNLLLEKVDLLLKNDVMESVEETRDLDDMLPFK